MHSNNVVHDIWRSRLRQCEQTHTTEGNNATHMQGEMLLNGA